MHRSGPFLAFIIWFAVVSSAHALFNPDDEARQHGVWTRRVASKAEKVTFYHWKLETK